MSRLLLLALALFALALGWMSRQAMSDDAYINLRLVRNALEGKGWHYNAGEVGVQAATSPLNLLLTTTAAKTLNLFGLSTVDASLVAAQGIFVLSLLALALAAYALASALGAGSFTSLAAGVVAVSSPVLLFSAGLETPLLLALVLGALACFQRGALRWAGLLAGFAVLARHDALILLVLMTGAAHFGKQRIVPLLQSAAAVMVTWFVFAALYFGSTVPTTLSTKMAQGGTMYWPAPYYSHLWKWLVASSFGIPLAAGAFCIAAAIGMYVAVRRRFVAVALLILYVTLHFAAYSFLGVPDYHWYFAPYFVAIAFVAVFGISFLRKEALAAVAAIGIAIAAVWNAPSRDERLTAYFVVAEHLERNPPLRAAGMMEIGIIGFFAPNVAVYDFSGVVTPAQIPLVAANDATAWLENPSVADKVVIRGAKHPLEPDFDPRFEGLYEQEFATPATSLFPNGLQVWRLKR